MKFRFAAKRGEIVRISLAMNPIISEAPAAAMPAQLRELARNIDQLAKTGPANPEQLHTALADALPQIFGPAGNPRRAPPLTTQQIFDEYGAIWVRPRRAAKISGLGLTKIYSLLSSQALESRLCGGARLISVASLLTLGEEQAPQFPARLAAARLRRAADADAA
jgi:hypothetical protein